MRQVMVGAEHGEQKRRSSSTRNRALCACFVLLFCIGGAVGRAQENPLSNVQTQAPPPALKTPDEKKPIIEGGDNAAAQATAHRKDARIRVDVNLVLVPMTVTDPLNRLVTGLEKENFYVYDNNNGQTIKSFSTEDAPLTIGIVFDLSGSMSSKFIRARKALTEFLRTSNPQDEFLSSDSTTGPRSSSITPRMSKMWKRGW